MGASEIQDRVLFVNPGDRVVLEVGERVNADHYKHIIEQMKNLWPDNECVVVVGHLRVERCE